MKLLNVLSQIQCNTCLTILKLHNHFMAFNALSRKFNHTVCSTQPCSSQKSRIASYLEIISNLHTNCSLRRQIGHSVLGLESDSAKWLLPFIRHRKCTQCRKPNICPISWHMVLQARIRSKDIGSLKWNKRYSLRYRRCSDKTAYV